MIESSETKHVYGIFTLNAG